jgi:hypothetical protein
VSAAGGLRRDRISRYARHSWYLLYKDAIQGHDFVVLRPLGALPRAERFTHLRPPTPRGIGNWPDVLWFERTDGVWKRFAIVQEFPVPDVLLRRIGKRHAETVPETGHERALSGLKQQMFVHTISVCRHPTTKTNV